MLSSGLLRLCVAQVALLDPDAAAVGRCARAQARADRQPQPRLRPVGLAPFAEAARKHEKLETAVGVELDRGSRRPLLQADVLARIPEQRHRLDAVASSDIEQGLRVGIDDHTGAIAEVELPELHEQYA